MPSYHVVSPNGKVQKVDRRKARKAPFLPESIQLPLRRVGEQVKGGLTGLVLQLAVAALGEMMEAELTERVGPKGRHRRERPAYRHGPAKGWVVVLGRKVSVQRPRARSKDRQEVVLDTYLWAQQDDSLTEAVVARLLHGVSTRGYRETLDGADVLPGKGVSRSRISARFTQTMGRLLDERLTQRLDQGAIVALVVDGVRVGDSSVVVALGIDADGRKRLLGLREGATENEAVVKALLQDLVERGLRYDEGLLVVMDGAKALRAAVRAVFGKQALVQRCQVHKKANVLDHLPESAKAWVARKLDQAYGEPDYSVAREALERLADRLEVEHPGAADSLREGLDETLTLHRLGIPGLLRLSLASTNTVESALSVVRAKAGRVKRWRSGQQAERWVGIGLLAAESRFRRIRGYRLIPMLQTALRRAVGAEVAMSEPVLATG